MMSPIRRLLSLCLVLAFATGLVIHGTCAADMNVKMTMAAVSDMPMQGKTDGCDDGNDTMSLNACFAICASMTALPTTPADLFVAPFVDVVAWSVEPSLMGHADPPDPYPPRPAVLS